MRTRLTHWTALFLLVMSGAAFGSLVESMFCAADARDATLSKAGIVAPQAQLAPGEDEQCPLATLAEFVAAPMVVSHPLMLGAMRAAFVAPLYLSPCYRVDGEPPTKPPSA